MNNAGDGHRTILKNERDVAITQRTELVADRILVRNVVKTDLGVLFFLNDLIPDRDGVALVFGRLEASRHVHKELIHIPMELLGKIGLEVERYVGLVAIQIRVDGHVVNLRHPNRGGHLRLVQIGRQVAQTRRHAKAGDRIAEDCVPTCGIRIH